MNLKRIYLVVNNDGPSFTNKEQDEDLCVWDLEHETKKDLVKGNNPYYIPAYIDLDEFE